MPRRLMRVGTHLLDFAADLTWTVVMIAIAAFLILVLLPAVLMASAT